MLCIRPHFISFFDLLVVLPTVRVSEVGKISILLWTGRWDSSVLVDDEVSEPTREISSWVLLFLIHITGTLSAASELHWVSLTQIDSHLRWC